MNDVDPQAWLAGVLTRLPDHPGKQIDELLPWVWKKARQTIPIASMSGFAEPCYMERGLCSRILSHVRGSKNTFSLYLAGVSARYKYLEFRNKIQSRRTRERVGPHSGANGRLWRSAAAGRMAAASRYLVGVGLNRTGTLRPSVAVGSKSRAGILYGGVHLRSAADFEAADCNSRICAKSAPMMGGRAIQTSSSG